MENPINDSVFDTRDLIEYQNELSDSLVDNWNELSDDDHQASSLDEIFGTDGYEYADDIKDIFAEFEEQYMDEIQEYNDITEFCDELQSNASDYIHGEGVIHEDYFTDYTKDLLVDCGYIPKDMPEWIEIDYDATAENVKADYAEVRYNGEGYYIRNV